MPIQLDILVDDKGTPVPVTEKRRMPLQLRETPFNTEVALSAEVVSTLRAFEHTATQELMQSQQAMQESIQREVQTFRAVQSLNAIAAQATADFQRLAQSNARTHAQTVALVIKEDNERLQKMAASFRTDERLQRMLSSFQAIAGPIQSLINLPKEDHERLQRIAASFRAMMRYRNASR